MGLQKREIQQSRQARSRPGEKETFNIMLRERLAQGCCCSCRSSGVIPCESLRKLLNIHRIESTLPQLRVFRSRPGQGVTPTTPFDEEDSKSQNEKSGYSTLTRWMLTLTAGRAKKQGGRNVVVIDVVRVVHQGLYDLFHLFVSPPSIDDVTRPTSVDEKCRQITTGRTDGQGMDHDDGTVNGTDGQTGRGTRRRRRDTMGQTQKRTDGDDGRRRRDARTEEGRRRRARRRDERTDGGGQRRQAGHDGSVRQSKIIYIYIYIYICAL